MAEDDPSVREIVGDIAELKALVQQLPNEIARTYVRVDVDTQVQLRRDAEMTRAFDQIRALREDLLDHKKDNDARLSQLADRIGVWSRAIVGSIVGPIVVGVVLYLLLANRPG